MSKTKRRQLTDLERARAAQAKKLWLEKKKRDRVTQEDANSALGWSPSTFGQYINGVIPLNLEAALKISAYLGVSIADIYVDSSKLELRDVEALYSSAPPDAPPGAPLPAATVDKMIDGLSEEQITEVIKRLAERLDVRYRAELLSHLAATLASLR